MVVPTAVRVVCGALSNFSRYGDAMSTPAGSPDIDAMLAAALQVNGRASWGAVARALDLPERTAARRGQRLLDTGAVRVSAGLDTTIVGDARPLVVELETTAGRAMDVARALAGRPDASSVSVLEGSGEVVCTLLPRTRADSARLLLTELPVGRRRAIGPGRDGPEVLPAGL